MKKLMHCGAALLALLLMISYAQDARAAASVSANLAQRIASGTGPHEVIVTFRGMADRAALDALGVVSIKLTTLPMAGALLSEAQIDALRADPRVVSLYFNQTLRYSNYTSGQITGGHFVHDSLGIKGVGVTVAVLDSGTDATHPDLALGSAVVQNVKIVSDLGLAGGVHVFLEGQPNTDTTSGHGTHVSGTVAGRGTASASDARRPFYYAGIAPQAQLVGLGAGETLVILDALLGFDYAIANQQRYGIDIITNSWGSGDGTDFDPGDPINQASYEAYRRGMVVAFAASNSGPDQNTISQYALAPWVLSVAAGDRDKQLADFSSRGVAGDELKHPDLTAPGVDITSTRAPGTPVGALGPVVDPAHPEYTLRYHTISGTSMATPFVAGAAALMLSANPQLSPDQVEDILVQTTTPMPGYAFHEVGTGYIDVRAAVERASATSGNRAVFLGGDTRHAGQGAWAVVADADGRLSYDSKWRSRSDARASDGVYKAANARQGGVLRASFEGTAFKLRHPRSRDGGLADLFVDGVHRATLSFYSQQPAFGASSAVNDLGPGLHVVELRAVKDEIYVDGLEVDGRLFANGTEFVDESRTFSGTMGPSAQGLQTDQHSFEVGADANRITASLDWSGLAVDLDFQLVDPSGAVVASGATLSRPETLSFSVRVPGTYTYRVSGFVSVLAPYTLSSVVTRAVGPQ